MSAIPALNPVSRVPFVGVRFTEEEIAEVERISDLMKYGKDTDSDCIRLSELFFCKGDFGYGGAILRGGVCDEELAKSELMRLNQKYVTNEE